jgi:hypothetical protein
MFAIESLGAILIQLLTLMVFENLPLVWIEAIINPPKFFFIPTKVILSIQLFLQSGDD